MNLLVKEVTAALGVSEYEFLKTYSDIPLYRSESGYKVRLHDLPVTIQERCRALVPLATPTIPTTNVVETSTMSTLSSTSIAVPDPLPIAVDNDQAFFDMYDRAPYYNKREYSLYYPIVKDCVGLKGKELDQYVQEYNESHPDNTVTVPTIRRKRQAFLQYGRAGLLGQYGKNRGKSSVPDDLAEMFKNDYLGKPGNTFSRAYRNSVGSKIRDGYLIDDFPKVGAFTRRYRNSTPKASETLARKGKSKYNSTHAPHVTRDLSTLHVNEAWVSDHVQLDTMCYVPWLKESMRPWLTSWVDIKSGRLLGWYLNAKASNTDCIFAAFLNAALTYGIPRITYTDNGADYHSKDLAGRDTLSLAAGLGIDWRFTEPYTPQAKSIERIQKELNESFSIVCRGYCGPNSTKKPETLNDAVKAGNIETFDELKTLLAEHINGVLNTRTITSGQLKGKTPDQVWREGHKLSTDLGIIRNVTEQELRDMCWRRSRPFTVRQGAVFDSETNQRYISDTLWKHDRQKVYLFRDPRTMDIARVYDVETESFLCEARMIIKVAYFAKGEAEQSILSSELAQNTRINNAVQEAATPTLILSATDSINNLKAFNAALSNDPGTELPNVHNTNVPTLLTRMSGVRAKIAEQEQEGLQDISLLGIGVGDDAIAPPQKAPLFILEGERDKYMEDQSLANVG